MTLPYTLSGSPEDLIPAVLALPHPRFATIDGAMHDDLAARLADRGLLHRPLYLEGHDRAAVADGPHLVNLPDDRAVPRLMAVTGDGASPVFWAWDGTEAELFRHLRRKNMAQIPAEDPGQNPPWDNVFFRHADPNVLAMLLPVLTPDQRASFLGPARALAFYAPDLLGLVVARRPEGLPAATRETLRFTPDQYATLNANRQIRNRRRVMSYLRRVVPRVAGWSDDTLYREVVDAEETGAQAGLRTEHGHWLWAYLYVISARQIAQDPRSVESLKSQTRTADEILNEIFDKALADTRISA